MGDIIFIYTYFVIVMIKFGETERQNRTLGEKKNIIKFWMK